MMPLNVPKKQRLYDPRCADLAEIFLEERKQEPDYQDQLADMAADIQGAIEDWLFMNPKRESPT